MDNKSILEHNFGKAILFLSMIVVLLAVYGVIGDSGIEYHYDVLPHPQDSKYYVIMQTKIQNGKETIRQWHGYEGKWIDSKGKKEGKILGMSSSLDAALRRAIADSKVKEKNTVKKKISDFIHKDRDK